MAKDTAISPTRAQDFSAWYQAVVREADLAEMAHVRGCMVIKPWGYGIWNRMRKILDEEIQSRGHENVYFPVFIPLSYLQKEAGHVEGFAKEMAVVTHHRLEQASDGHLVPAAPLDEPLIVRPTSEAIIGESMAKWIQSYRDLPLLLNQWANVVRWELRPRVFLRTTEFLWQEGHTAHATGAEALAKALEIHRMYRDVAQDWLALPIISGEKSPTERFPGAEQSFSIEAMMQDGKAVQSGTSHYLGQNFARAANISFLDENGTHQYAFTTSWGVSTRLVGALVMTHGDDNGLCVPPRMAPHQIVISPLVSGHPDSDSKAREYAQELARAIGGKLAFGEPVRVHVDLRAYRPVDKKWQWLKKGVPIFIEIGRREINERTVSFRVRFEMARVPEQLSFAHFLDQVSSKLEDIQLRMFTAAETRVNDKIRRDIANVERAKTYFAQNDVGFVLAKWCGGTDCEIALKPQAVTIRCLPESLQSGTNNCLICGASATLDALWGQSY